MDTPSRPTDPTNTVQVTLQSMVTLTLTRISSTPTSLPHLTLLPPLARIISCLFSIYYVFFFFCEIYLINGVEAKWECMHPSLDVLLWVHSRVWVFISLLTTGLSTPVLCLREITLVTISYNNVIMNYYYYYDIFILHFTKFDGRKISFWSISEPKTTVRLEH